MKIDTLQIKNYRSITDLNLRFPRFYSAISGKNNSGKSNVLNAIRVLFGSGEDYYEDDDVSFKDDLPKWLGKESKDRTIQVAADLTVYEGSDAGLYKFLVDYLSLRDPDPTLAVNIRLAFNAESQRAVSLRVAGSDFEPLKAQEVLKKLQSSRSVLFHDSTELYQDYRSYRRVGSFATSQLPPADAEKLEAAKAKLSNTLATITKRQQRKLGELLGRLQEKYRIGISLPAVDFEYLPLSITLGDEAVRVGLEQWGSGTQNRTWILMTLFKAKRISQAETSASKITPVIVVEEPESFLHPSAQGEFGKVIQDLSEEFQVQVVVATHSPYMLSQQTPDSNILLERYIERRRLRDTRQIDTTGERWMEPFALALGLDNQQFEPWRGALFSRNDCILMVEGETDKAYFDLLRLNEHGNRRLAFGGEICSYGGKDFLKHQRMVQFIKERYKRCFITYDLDSEQEVAPSLTAIGLQKGKHHCPVGIDEPGKRSIEGLLPDRVVAAVYGANPDLVRQASQGSTAEKKTATGRLKMLYLEEFKRVAAPGEDFKYFYTLARTVDKGLTAQ